MEARDVNLKEVQACIDEFLREHPTCSLRIVRRDIRHFEVVLHEGGGTEKHRLILKLEDEKDEQDEKTTLRQVVTKKQGLRDIMNVLFDKHGKPLGADDDLHIVLDERMGCVIFPLVNSKFHDSYFVEDAP